MPLESSVAVNVTVTGDVYQLFAPLLPEALYVVTGGVMSLTLPGETAYVDGVDVGIVNVSPPTGVDCALRIRFVPPLFARVTLKVALVAAGEVTKVTGVRSVFVIPGPRSTTVPWKPVGRRIGVIATVEYVVS